MIDVVTKRMRGWAAPLRHKTLFNELVDVHAVNVPEFLKDYKDPGCDLFGRPVAVSPCSSFVYATYLPPGLHQFLIYIPGRSIKIAQELRHAPAPAAGADAITIPSRLYCKNIIVNLSQCDPAPVIPFPSEEKPPPKTVSNVWRRWRHDSEEDVAKALINDISHGFGAQLFMKEEQDIE